MEMLRLNHQKRGENRMPPKMKQRKATKKPEFLKNIEQKEDFDVDEYLKSVLGREPYVNNAKRRWRFLIAFCRFVYEKREVTYITMIRWFARYCEVMKPRTIKESYIEYLETLGIICWNENTKMIEWKGESFEHD